jgi:hypothetical protein
MKIAGAVLLIVASVAAFGQFDPSQFNLAADPPFTLTIDCGLSAIPQDPLEHIVISSEQSTVCVKKTNISDHEIMETPRMARSFAYHLDVRDSDGREVGPRHPNEKVMNTSNKEMIILGSREILVQPNESKMQYLPLASQFDIRNPGDYTIQVWTHVSDDPKSDIVKSNIITVTVLPPPPPQAEEPK